MRPLQKVISNGQCTSRVRAAESREALHGERLPEDAELFGTHGPPEYF
jgi:hypothetical protein